MSSDFQHTLERLAAGADLSACEAYDAFGQVMSGALSELQIRTLLDLIAQKGECVDELVGAARAMRDSALPIHCDTPCTDTCGTGGDGISTFNVSTAAAIIAAAADNATFAKHGNTSTTRKSGSTEVLTHLGVDVEADRPIVERCLREVGIGYLNARLLHPAMKYTSPVRRRIPHRTIFNLLGPLTNPAGARRQLLGVAKPQLVDLMAQALLVLGVDRAWVVHGDGLCDVTITGPTLVVEIQGSTTTRGTIQPEDFDLARAPVDALLIRSPAESADAIRGILAGKPGPQRNHALMNAGAALVVAGVAADLHDGIARAANAIDSGAAQEKLKRFSRVSNGK